MAQKAAMRFGAVAARTRRAPSPGAALAVVQEQPCALFVGAQPHAPRALSDHRSPADHRTGASRLAVAGAAAGRRPRARCSPRPPCGSGGRHRGAVLLWRGGSPARCFAGGRARLVHAGGASLLGMPLLGQFPGWLTWLAILVGSVGVVLASGSLSRKVKS
jgi:hypothetical protein